MSLHFYRPPVKTRFLPRVLNKTQDESKDEQKIHVFYFAIFDRKHLSSSGKPQILTVKFFFVMYRPEISFFSSLFIVIGQVGRQTTRRSLRNVRMTYGQLDFSHKTLILEALFFRITIHFSEPIFVLLNGRARKDIGV